MARRDELPALVLESGSESDLDEEDHVNVSSEKILCFNFLIL